jgi:hypothetical protein
MTKPTVYVAAYDLHFPKYDKPTFDCMIEFIEDIKPAWFVFGGDQLDNAEISHHNAKKPLYKPQGAYKRNTQRFDEEILTVVERALPRGAERVWIIGNHCDWERQFVESHPEFEGWVERPQALRLEARGWEVIPIGYTKRVGNLNIIHGEVLTGIGNQAGMYPSRKAVELYGDNVLAGHTHAPQSFAKISPVEQKKKHMAWISPIVGAVNPDYLINRPTAWINGFVIIEFHGKGNFNLYPINVFNGTFSYGGKIYSAD